MKQFTISKLLVAFFMQLCYGTMLASNIVTVEGFRFLIDTDENEATLLSNDYSGEIVIPEKVTFEGIDYPITVLSSNCFGTKVTSVKIPNTVRSLASKCFYQAGIKSIEIPNSVAWLGASCFEYSDLTTIQIPESVLGIGESCFESSDLENVTLPKSLTYIAKSCFGYCRKLKEISIPSSVTSFGDYVFYQCSSLARVDLPESLESIGDRCFFICSSLEQIIIPSSMKYMGSETFDQCNNLRMIVCKALTPPVHIRYGMSYGDIFEDFDKRQCTLIVPRVSLDAYNSSYWKGFGEIKAIEGEVEEAKSCLTPTIAYISGNLSFESSTAGAEYHYTIKDADVATDKYNTDGQVQLNGKLDISVYATADGYKASDKATATLYWLNAEGGDDTNNINLVKTRGVMVTTDSDITISGLNDGEVVTFYSVNGVNLGSAKAVQGVLHFAKPNESIVIAKIKGNDLKIAIK